MPSALVPEIWSIIAPRRLMSVLLADRILVVTGFRVLGSMFSFCRRLVPARQLWHAVSATALIVVVVLVLSDKLGFVRSSTLMLRVMTGCGFDLPSIHFCCLWSYMWWLMAWRDVDCHGYMDALQAPWGYRSVFSVTVSIPLVSSSIEAAAEFIFFSPLHTLA